MLGSHERDRDRAEIHQGGVRHELGGADGAERKRVREESRELCQQP